MTVGFTVDLDNCPYGTAIWVAQKAKKLLNCNIYIYKTKKGYHLEGIVPNDNLIRQYIGDDNVRLGLDIEHIKDGEPSGVLWTNKGGHERELLTVIT